MRVITRAAKTVDKLVDSAMILVVPTEPGTWVGRLMFFLSHLEGRIMKGLTGLRKVS